MLRTVQTRTPFFLPVTVPFTSTAAETVQVSTNPSLSPGNGPAANGDLEILGMTSDLVNVKGAFKLNKKKIWSDDRIPLPMLFGAPDGPSPFLWLEEPMIVPQGHRIYCDLLNVGAEPAGTLVFAARIRGEYGPVISYDPDAAKVGDMDDIAVIDSTFTGSATETPRVPSAIIEEDYLIRGLHTNLQSATVRITGVGGRLWNEDPIPLWAIAGSATSAKPVQRLKDPYFVPKGYKILVEFANPASEASGQLYLKGQRLADEGK